MRLTDLEKFKLIPEAPKDEPKTREVNLKTEEVVSQMRADTSLAKEKILNLPKELKETLMPFFEQKFWRVGTNHG